MGGILSNDEERMSYLRRKSNKLRIKFVLFLNKLYLCLCIIYAFFTSIKVVLMKLGDSFRLQGKRIKSFTF